MDMNKKERIIVSTAQVTRGNKKNCETYTGVFYLTCVVYSIFKLRYSLLLAYVKRRSMYMSFFNVQFVWSTVVAVIYKKKCSVG
jgi:hypothetical protein